MFYRTLLALAFLTAVGTFAARAETAEERQACMSDAQTHCGDEIPDRQRVYECLVRKVNQISPPCRRIISESIAASRRRK
jgi:Cysteine rich repeat